MRSSSVKGRVFCDWWRCSDWECTMQWNISNYATARAGRLVCARHSSFWRRRICTNKTRNRHRRTVHSCSISCKKKKEKKNINAYDGKRIASTWQPRRIDENIKHSGGVVKIPANKTSMCGECCPFSKREFYFNDDDRPCASRRAVDLRHYFQMSAVHYTEHIEKYYTSQETYRVHTRAFVMYNWHPVNYFRESVLFIVILCYLFSRLFPQSRGRNTLPTIYTYTHTHNVYMCLDVYKHTITSVGRLCHINYKGPYIHGVHRNFRFTTSVMASTICHYNRPVTWLWKQYYFFTIKIEYHNYIKINVRCIKVKTMFQANKSVQNTFT